MLFNSIDFAFFMPVVFCFYWALGKNVKAQNIFLLAASYFFYAWWDWRYLSLILICSAANYSAGLLMMKYRSPKIRKTVLTVCCIVCFGILGVFKYCDFFIRSFVHAFRLLGADLDIHTLNLILPVGISFYTFHTLSYTIDVYRGKFEPTKNVVSFFLFVSIFPLAMAGPIERATHLLPQIYKKRTFDYNQATDGMRQILWGLFKKVVVADNCATIVNGVFADWHSQPGSMLLCGAVFFAFQIYGDFSGYSDMAIGIGKLLGFRFLDNFRYPYFSRDIAEFWRRWHISLNTWFRDYLYIPLGGSRGSKAMVVRNTFIIFLVSGLWHGANWTFIAWGAFHAALFLPLILLHKNRKYTDTVAEGKLLPGLKELLQMLLTFCLVTIGWVLFRANSIGEAFGYLKGMAHLNTLKAVHTIFYINIGDFGKSGQSTIPLFALIIFMLVVEWLQRNKQHGMENIGLKWNKWGRYAFYFILAFVIVVLGFNKAQPSEFIYFQF